MHTWIDPLGIKLMVVGESAEGYDISVRWRPLPHGEIRLYVCGNSISLRPFHYPTPNGVISLPFWSLRLIKLSNPVAYYRRRTQALKKILDTAS